MAIEKYCKTKRQQRSLELVLSHVKSQQIIGHLAKVFEREVYLNNCKLYQCFICIKIKYMWIRRQKARGVNHADILRKRISYALTFWQSTKIRAVEHKAKKMIARLVMEIVDIEKLAQKFRELRRKALFMQIRIRQ